MKCALDKIKHTDNIEMCIRQNKAQNKAHKAHNIEMCIRQNKAHR